MCFRSPPSHFLDLRKTQFRYTRFLALQATCQACAPKAGECAERLVKQPGCELLDQFLPALAVKLQGSDGVWGNILFLYELEAGFNQLRSPGFDVFQGVAVIHKEQGVAFVQCRDVFVQPMVKRLLQGREDSETSA